MATDPKALKTEARLSALIDKLGSGYVTIADAATNTNTDQGTGGSHTDYDFDQLVGRVNHAKDVCNAHIAKFNDLLAALSSAGIISS